MWLLLTKLNKKKDNMFMRVFLNLLFIVAVLSCSCLERNPPPQPIVYPNKELKEIIIMGRYYLENKEEKKDAEKEYRERGGLKEGESFEEKYSHLKIGEEVFLYFEREYCYNETEAKEPVFNKSLRIRLYDREGRRLVEDYLRLWCDKPQDRYRKCYPGDRNPILVAYLPYHDEGHEIRIVRSQGRKEVILKKLSFET